MADINKEIALQAEEANFGKGISVASGFDLGAKSPLDSRDVVKTIEERDAHVSGNRAYEGMKVYVEEDGITYKYVKNADKELVWEEDGFSQSKFDEAIKPIQTKITSIENKNNEQDTRLDSLEKLVVGGEGEGLESIISDVAQTKEGLSQEILDREAADKAIESKISTLDAAYKNADVAIKSRLDTLETNTSDLEQIRTDIKTNTTAIQSEVSERTTAIKNVETKINTEISEVNETIATNNTNLTTKLSDIEQTVTENLATSKADATTKANQALTDAKSYADSKIATAKTEAISDSKTYTDGKISDLINGAPEAYDTLKELADAIGENKAGVTDLLTAVGSKAEKTYVDTELAKKASSTDLTAEISERKAEDAKLSNKIDNLTIVVSANEPSGYSAGHIWLELL
jgi:hypothetical protein